MRFPVFCLLFTACFILTVSLSVYAESVDDIHVLKISPQDERAVIKTSERELQIIKVGDLIGENGTITEITTGRVVIEEMTDRGPETVIIRLEGKEQRIERIKKT